MMTTVSAPSVNQNTINTGTEPLNLYKLGMLFVVKCRFWSCRAGNDPDELDLTSDRIDAKAIASFGTKDLLDPQKTRKQFQTLEKKARHALEKHSRPFAAANAHFVPWNLVQAVIDELQLLRIQFDDTVFEFLNKYPVLRAEWQSKHFDIPDACYPLPMALP